MIPSQKALKIILAKSKPLPQTTIPLAQALNYVLAQDIFTPLDFPPFSKSAMDGYAIAKGDTNTEFRVVGEVAAGQIYAPKIKKGTAIKIMTGAMVPANTGQVIMKEHVILLSSRQIKVTKNNPKDNICYQGEDIKKGAKLFAQGELITPVMLANLAFAGRKNIRVYQQPKIGLLVTGSELLGPGQKYQPGKIYDSNGPLLSALLHKLGFTKNTGRRTKDSLTQLKKTFQQLLTTQDVIFFTGGVSVGDYDYIYEVLRQTGCKIYFNQVAIQPGKPLTFATYLHKPIFCFPGNPVSVFTTFYLFALPALYKMMGHDFKHQVYECQLQHTFKRRRSNRELYFPVKYTGANKVQAIPHQGSGDLYSLSQAQALMIVPVGQSVLKKGAKVKVVSLNV